MRIPKAIQNLIESFERLPGVGPKTAQRLTFYLLHVPQHELDRFAQSLKNLKTGTVLCSVCYTIAETDPCDICSNPERDHSVICIVEQPLDVLALEKGANYTGVYHVLHGRIDPLNNIGPDEIYIKQLLDRIRNPSASLRVSSGIKEIILATNPTMEGEATAMYINKQLKALAKLNPDSIGTNPDLIGANPDSIGVKITRIGRGLPVGADIEYADEVTLQRAMEGRREC